MTQKLRNACFTCYDLENHETKLLNNDKFTYIIYQEEECPSTHRHHLQGYIEFEQMRFNTLKNILPTGTHIEPRKGTQEQAIAYCMKLESHINGPWTKGEPKKQGKRNDLIAFRDDIKEGASTKELLETHPEAVAKYPHFMNLCKLEYQTDRSWKTELIVFWGDSGTGKTRKVFDECPTVKTLEWTGTFMLGYNNEENVLFDDFTPNTWKRDFFLRLTDRYPMTINVKGGERKWNPKRIYITSNYDPEMWFVFNDPAVLRRIDRSERFVNPGSEVSASEVA